MFKAGVTLLQGRVKVIRPGVSQESRDKAQSTSPVSPTADTNWLRKGRKGGYICEKEDGIEGWR